MYLQTTAIFSAVSLNMWKHIDYYCQVALHILGGSVLGIEDITIFGFKNKTYLQTTATVCTALYGTSSLHIM
jgi:hypothetical protein